MDSAVSTVARAPGPSGLLAAPPHAVGGNQAQLLVDEPAVMAAITDAIRGARSTVHVSMYSWKPDGAGAVLADELRRAAARGVQVQVAFDATGSGLNPFSDAMRAVQQLRQDGVQVRVEGSFLDEVLMRPVDHRKLVVVDGDTAFVGGMNMAARYSSWRDAMVRLQGPVATQLQHEAEHGGSAQRRASAPLPPGPVTGSAPAGSTQVTVLSNDKHGERRASEALIQKIDGATSRIWAETPFLGDERVTRALEAAARRGVDVRLGVVGRDAFPAFPLMSRTWYAGLLDAGVKVYELPAMTHRKVVVADDEAMIGSVNLTTRAMGRDAELAVALVGQPVDQIAALLASDYAAGKDVGANWGSPVDRLLATAPVAGVLRLLMGAVA